MKCKRKFMAAVLLMSAVMLSGSVELYPSGVAFANSANREYRGYDSSGVIVTTENCPIVVDKEVLTFDIYSCDDSLYGMWRTYNGNVTAEYTFRNPSELTAEVRCMFPLGFLPLQEETFPGADVIAVKKNGVDVSTKLRYSYKNYSNEYFDRESDWNVLLDDYMQDDFFKTDMPVYEYEITANKKSAFIRYSYKENGSFYVISDDAVRENSSAYVIRDDSVCDYEDGVTTLTKRIADDGKMTFAFVGEDIEVNENDFELLDSTQSTVNGNVTIEKKSACMLKDYLLKFRPDWLDASDVDWYNVSLNIMKTRKWLTQKSDFNLYSLFCWYDYTLTFEPGETLVNTVVAPLYPTINLRYKPAVFEYVYLLSPASTWADFKDLTIRINNGGGYLIESGIQKRTILPHGVVNIGKTEALSFEKGVDFYETHFDKLPDGELIFKLCSAEYPTRGSGCGARCA